MSILRGLVLIGGFRYLSSKGISNPSSWKRQKTSQANSSAALIGASKPSQLKAKCQVKGELAIHYLSTSRFPRLGMRKIP